MKYIHGLVLIILFLFAKVSFASSFIISFHIEGLLCPFCLNVLTTNLKKIAGIEEAEMSSDNKTIQLTLNSDKKPNVLAIKKTIIDSGFTPTEMESVNLPRHIDIKNQDCNSCHKQ